MNFWYWILILAVIWYLSNQAGRLDRLHHRIDVTSAALDGHLGRRAGIVAEISNASPFDPVTNAVLAQASHDALAAEPHELLDRIDVENELSEVLLSTFENSDELAESIDDPIIAQLVAELAIVCSRISLSHSFHTEAVNDCVIIRNQWLVRICRLAGHAQLPKTFNLCSEVPAALLD